MASKHPRFDPRNIPVFDLGDAPEEISAGEEAMCLLPTAGLEPPALQVWIGPKALTLEPPVAGQEIVEVTLWEHYVYRWLTQLGVKPGETAYLVWMQDTTAAIEGAKRRFQIVPPDLAG